MEKRKGKGRGKFKKEKPEFDQQIVDLARVTRVTKGGKQLSFRACVVIGNRKGRVGYGVKKGKDVQIAVDKAVNQAKKYMITVPINRGTIPHRVEAKYGAGRVLIKPAPLGSGIIAGSSVRIVLELAGVPNASAKIMSKTNNKITNVKAVFEALQKFKPLRFKKFVKKDEVKTEEKTEVKKPFTKKKENKIDNK
ncbi:MAG: 30S ribosomal protein S5 [Candidatus Magasanikbacteria bacterium RIFOXYB2_FULL_40_13]|uniref:Small ribosomal subunit protein uS5 n=1 Tax=Candidatus Magasanikbacteria bacterium RIFOXYA1_FULL_40_8 TaxID=1798694 RepID=A0A1F6NT28_9BACT|nr:MAG: 30S ribosomal protein S5 [Candidatus Magasanikbacteria bacterium RIFOXYA2_FULL_40_20]OGH85163.1 MAG: 30S ribosomal protein S5 [Candidatus Magasanikbacteria bacterium RIFOXYB2_FULL_40_13]OGH87071.1 MAG: 30S ribosomal protein S5 [Candidatus Magasanikbacteria bacterium RIFOXYA1_FULL_40_8]